MYFMGERKKFSVGLGFTSSCNMNCSFCYSRNKRYAYDECNINDWFSFISSNHIFIGDINYGTSENSTSDDWYRFISWVREYYPGITQAVTTNGSLGQIVLNNISRRITVANCIDEVDVSLDFANETQHNMLRGNNNAFKWVIETLEFCRDSMKPTSIVMLGIDETLNERNLEGIFSIAEKYNTLIRLNLYRNVGRDSPFKPASFKTINWLFDWVECNHKFISVSDPLFSSIYFDNYHRTDPSGSSSIRIIQNGDIFPSTYLLTPEMTMGNIRDFLLREIHDNSIFKIIDGLLPPQECFNCAYASTCRGGTLDRRYLSYGSFSQRDPYCPYREENINIGFDKVSCHINYSSFSSVHDRYLPTLFFGV